MKLSETLEEELGSLTERFPWLAKLDLSPYAKLVGGRMLGWLESEPDDRDPERPVLHISSPAGEDLADVLAIIAAAYSTEKALNTSADPIKFELGELVNIAITGSEINAYFRSYDRQNKDNVLRVVVSITEHGELISIPITYNAIRRSFKIVPSAGSTITSFVKHAHERYNRPSKLDVLFDRRKTLGVCNEDQRKPVLFYTDGKGVSQNRIKSVQYGDISVDKLLSLERTGIHYFQKSFDQCLSGRAAEVRSHIVNDLLPLLEQCGIDALSETQLRSMSNAGLDPWLKEQEALAKEKGKREHDAVKELTGSIGSKLKDVSDDLFEPDTTLCIICKGYSPLSGSDDGFERLISKGARIVVVGGPWELMDDLRDREIEAIFTRRAKQLLQQGIGFPEEITPEDRNHQDKDIIAGMDGWQTSIALITLAGQSADQAFIGPRHELFEALRQIDHRGVRDIRREHLLPVMRTLSMLPDVLPDDTRTWIDEHLATARTAMEAFRADLPPMLLDPLDGCLNAIELVMDRLTETPGIKGRYIDKVGENKYHPTGQWLYQDDDAGVFEEYYVIRPFDPIPEEVVEEGEDGRPSIALTGWNGVRAANWLFKHTREKAFHSVRIVGHEREIRAWKKVLNERYDWKRSGLPDELIATELSTCSPYHLQEEFIVREEPIPDTPAQEPLLPINDVDPEPFFEQEDRLIKHVSGIGNGDTVSDVLMVLFSDGRYMYCPENGSLDLFALGRSKVEKIKPRDMDIGRRLLWSGKINDVLKSGVLDGLSEEERRKMHFWRDELSALLKVKYSGNRAHMADDMKKDGFVRPKQDLDRWLDEDIYTPEASNLEKILKFTRPEMPDRDRSAMIKIIGQARRVAPEKRRAMKEDVLKQLQKLKGEALELLAGQRTVTVSILSEDVDFELLDVEKAVPQSGTYHHGDMYRLFTS